jgi:hypothetical protein
MNNKVTKPNTKKPKQYNHRDCGMELDNYYMTHKLAMTAESLHSKSEIACELAVRDMCINQLIAGITKPEELPVITLPFTLNDARSLELEQSLTMTLDEAKTHLNTLDEDAVLDLLESHVIRHSDNQFNSLDIHAVKRLFKYLEHCS